MKLSSAIVRAVVAFLAISIIQVVAGMLVPMRPLPGPQALQWMMITLSNALVVSVLAAVALRSEWRGWKLGFAISFIPLVIESVNLLEGIVFLPNSGIEWGKVFLFMGISAGLAIPVWTWLFGRRTDAPPHYDPIRSQSQGERVWKFAVSDVSYVFLYLAAGTIIFPYVKDFYATQRVPAMGAIVGLQLLVRGPVFVALCLALVRMLGLPRLSGALAVGAVFTILSGVAPLLMPNPVFPDSVRWVHFCEVTSVNFVFGAIVGWLWGCPSVSEPAVLHQAA